MYVMSEELLIKFQHCRRMPSIEFHVTLGRRAEINNDKCNYPYKRRNRWIEQLVIFLCSLRSNQRFKFNN